ncbi:MAG: hypothetical protein WBA74_19400 [Cyclobacteriaceae bacterium]
MNIKNSLILMAGLSFGSLFLASCGDDEPEAEEVEEIITDVTLIFTPVEGGTAVTATATDPDGEGAQSLQVNGSIELAANTTYKLTMNLVNGLEDESISEEVKEEDDEHQFFFGFTNSIFSDPTGNGNIDSRNDDINYQDQDDGGLPLGLETEWTTGDAATGTFRVVLKHQPDIKSSTSTASDGESDMDITWTLNIQ